MDKRILGNTKLEVSCICMGTMTYGQQNTLDEAFRLLDISVDHGVNFLDAAELYPIPPKPETQGRTEEYIGQWMKARSNRDKMIVATKIVGRTEMNWFRDDKSSCRITRKNVQEAVEKSLKRLQTDYIDLYQIHWPDRLTTQFGANPTVFVPQPEDMESFEDQLDCLNEFVKAGKIRHIGLSNESTWGTMKFIEAAKAGHGPKVVSVQNAYNLVNRTYETNMAEMSMREKVGLLAYSPLAQGLLSGKYMHGAKPPKGRITLFSRIERYQTPNAEQAIEAYVNLAREHDIDPAQMAIQFVTQKPFVTSNIIGATTEDQLISNLESVNLKLSPELLKQIDSIQLKYCNPCP